MEVLNQKKRRKKVTFAPQVPKPQDISDDQYPTIIGQEPPQLNESGLQQKLQHLVSDYYIKTKEKQAPDTLEQTQKKIFWLDHMSITNNEISLQPHQLANDFKREINFYNLTLQNAKIGLQKLKKLKVPIWRPSDFKAEMFKTEKQMEKVQENLSQIKKKIELVEKRKQVKNRKKFAELAHKKHVKAKQMKISDKKKTKKNRAGKWVRKKKKSEK